MSFEFTFLDWIQGMHTPVGDALAIFTSKIGDHGMLWIALAFVLLIIPKTRKSGLMVAAALILDLIVCNIILKNLVARPRPCDINTAITMLVERPDGYSFPSGHAASSFAATAALFFAKEKKIWVAALIASILICAGRLYLYVHFPTDVLGGIIIGIIVGFAGYFLVDKLWQSIAGKRKKTV